MDAKTSPQMIYKILRAEEWRAAKSAGVFRGSPDDKRDGFIHCSTATQTIGTFEKYFAGQDGLMLLAVDADALGGALKWEVSRGGELFPHIYGELPLSAVRRSVTFASISDLRQLIQ